MSTDAVLGRSVIERDERFGARAQRLLSGWITLYVILWLSEGALRKWIVPVLYDPLYFARDVLTLVLLLFLIVTGLPHQVARLLNWALVLVLGLAVLASAQALVTAQPLMSLGVGMLTYAAPIAAVVMALCLDDSARLFLRVERIVLTAIPVQAVLTVVQTLSPISSTWNRVGEGDGVSLTTSAEVVRATGTFMSPSGLTAFAALSTALVLGRLIGRQRRFNPLHAACVPGLVVIVALGGSRGAVLSVIVMGAGVLIWAVGGGSRGAARTVRIVASVAAVYVLVRLTGFVFPAVTAAFARRFEEAGASEDSSTRIQDSAFGYFDELDSVSWLGDGLGSHTLSGIAAGSDLGWYEVELSRYVAELGLLGVVLCLARQVIAVALLVACWRRGRRDADVVPFLLALALLPSLLYGATFAPASQAAFVVVTLALVSFAWRSTPVERQQAPPGEASTRTRPGTAG